MTQVERIMEMVEDYTALASNWNSGNTSQTTPHLVVAAHKTLVDALTQLLEPSEEQVETACSAAAVVGNDCGVSSSTALAIVAAYLNSIQTTSHIADHIE